MVDGSGVSQSLASTLVSFGNQYQKLFPDLAPQNELDAGVWAGLAAMGVAGSFLWGTGSYMQESAEVSVPASQVTLTRKGSTFRPQADTPLTELTTVKTRLDDSQRQLPAVQGRTEAEKGAASDLESLRAENSALQEKFATLQTRERESCEATERSKQEATTYRNNLLKVREENRRLRKRLQQGQEGHHSRSTQNTTQSRRNSANGTGQQSKLSGKSRESLIKSKSPSGHHSRVGPPGDQQRRSEQRGRTPGSMAPQLVERSETSDEIDDEGYATADPTAEGHATNFRSSREAKPEAGKQTAHRGGVPETAADSSDEDEDEDEDEGEDDED